MKGHYDQSHLEKKALKKIKESKEKEKKKEKKTFNWGLVSSFRGLVNPDIMTRTMVVGRQAVMVLKQ